MCLKNGHFFFSFFPQATWLFNTKFQLFLIEQKRSLLLSAFAYVVHIRVGLSMIGCICVYNSPCLIPDGSMKTVQNYSTSETRRVWIDSYGKFLKYCPNLSPSAVSQARG